MDDKRLDKIMQDVEKETLERLKEKEEIKGEENKKLKNNRKIIYEDDNKKVIVWYIVKVLILFNILFFTFVETTDLIMAFVMFPYIYIPIYIWLLIFLSKYKIKRPKNDSIFEIKIKPILSLIIGIVVLFGGYFLGLFFCERIKVNYVRNFMTSADECIFYNTNEEYIYNLINREDYKNEIYPCDTIMIDYDKGKIGFVHGDFEDYDEFKLIKGVMPEELVKETKVQTGINLESPGKKFISYHENENELGHVTRIIKIIMDNGEEYYAETVDEDGDGIFLDLRGVSEDRIVKKVW